jgi:hypothetical protein
MLGVQAPIRLSNLYRNVSQPYASLSALLKVKPTESALIFPSGAPPLTLYAAVLGISITPSMTA